MDLLTLTHADEDGTYWPVEGATIAGLTQLVCDDHSTATGKYARTCPTCDGRLTLPVPVTGVNLTISFLSYKGRMACPQCSCFGIIGCHADGTPREW